MEYHKTCRECGAEFVAFHNKAIRCPKCRETGFRKDKLEEKPKEEKERDVTCCDTQENIDKCLSCIREICFLDINQSCPILSSKKRREIAPVEFQRICLECKQPFIGKGGRATYCKACSEERRRRFGRINRRNYKARIRNEQKQKETGKPQSSANDKG